MKEENAVIDSIGLSMISLLGSKNPIDEYYKGMPCMYNGIVGKIVGESLEGSWGVINGVNMFSIPLFSTPHGTVMKIGVMHLSKITDDGMAKLLEYEKQQVDAGNVLYAGMI